MDRIIKFRMWNGESKKYHYDVENVFQCVAQQNVHDKTMQTRGLTYPYSHELDGSAFEQFTGICDRDGMEIYEGDILNRSFMDFYDKEHGVVGFKEGCFVIMVGDDYRPLGTGFGWSDHNRYYNGAGIKVIGNIHESTPTR